MALADHMNDGVRALQASDVLQFNADISEIEGMVKLTLGEPDFPTPEHVKAAGIASIENNESHYTQSKGLPNLRAAASNYLATKYGTRYDPDTQILITAGATGGIFSSLTAMLNKGDTVIVPTPIFPLYIPIILMNGAKPIFIDTSADGFILKPEKLKEALEANKDTVKAIVLNYPTNPTGVTYNRTDLEALAEIIKQYEIFVLSDEIYSELSYSGTHVSMGEVLPDQAVVLNGVSKSHAMTGWRVGITAGPADVIGEIGKVSEFTITSVTTNAQRAAEEALTNGMNDTEPMKKAYLERRDFLAGALTDAGLTVTNPQGAFYIFAKLPERMHDSWKFVRSLASEAKVALIPGAAFGPGGEGYVRISYAASMEQLKLATERIAAYMQTH